VSSHSTWSRTATPPLFLFGGELTGVFLTCLASCSKMAVSPILLRLEKI
jgi:hypothetical protein